MDPNPIREILRQRPAFEWIFLYTNVGGVNVWDYITSEDGAADLQAQYDLPSPPRTLGDVYQ